MKNLIVLFSILILIAGFVLFMRHQNIKKEQREFEAKERIRAFREAEKERNALQKLEQQQEQERQERERKQAEEQKEQERLKRAGEQARQAEKQARIDALERQLREDRHLLNDLRNGTADGDAEIRALTEEIAAIDRLLNDTRYKCFDFCVKFQNIEFSRVMRSYRVNVDNRGYYTGGPSPYKMHYYGKNRSKSRKTYSPIAVTYHCNTHNIDWNKSSAEKYEREHYTSKNALEGRKKRLTASLARSRTRAREENAGRIAELEKKIRDTEAGLRTLTDGAAAADR